jgi:hypothetical protein
MIGQAIFVRHSGESRNPETAIEIPWIPAFAGMTG